MNNYMINNHQTAIVGIGNELRGDDGIGPYIVSLMQKTCILLKNPGIGIFNIGQDCFSLLGIIEKYERTIILDCAIIGRKPGEFRIFDLEDEDISEYPEGLSSVHSFSIIDTAKLAVSIYKNKKILLIGIQPKDTSVSDLISEDLKNMTNKIIKEIQKLLGEKI